MSAPGVAESEVASVLDDLVAIRSDSDVGDVIQYVHEWFLRRGIDAVVQSVEGVPINVVATVGHGAPSILLNTHLDTVPSGAIERWSGDPFTPIHRDGHVVGRGSADAKGSLAAMMVALERLARSRPTAGRVLLSAVGGEEHGGIGTKHLIREGLVVEAAIVGEPTSLHPVVAHKGVLRVTVTVRGSTAHASQPELGVNAIDAMASVVIGLRDLASEVRARQDTMTGAASLVVTKVRGGTALNVVPDRCDLSIDRRLIPSENLDGVLAELDAALAATRLDAGARVERSVLRYIAPAATSSEALVTTMREAAERAAGRPREPLGFMATCDMSHLVHQGGVPTIVFGPGSLDQAHQYDECVPLSEVVAAANAYTDAVLTWWAR